MGPKQAEMDEILGIIWHAVQKSDTLDNQHTLLVVCGDHGMTAVCPPGFFLEPIGTLPPLNFSFCFLLAFATL
jgi:arylsulfatase A-like enzyme